MLEELEVRNLGPIRSAMLRPGKGMTAITGETGAGKSMLLSALRMISGDSAKVARVSPKADKAWAQGIFDVDPNGAAAGIARDSEVLADEGQADPDPDEAGHLELFLTRTVPVSGRSRAVLCGHSVPRALLGDVARELVTIHGQADQLRIASAARQREFLDMVAEDGKELEKYRKAWSALQQADERLAKLTGQEAETRARADYLRDSIKQINDVDPKPGEEKDLKEKRARIEHAAEIAKGVGSALSALDASQVDTETDEAGASDAITHAIQALRTIHAGDAFGEAADRLESLNADLSDIVFSLSNEMGEDVSDEGLDAINARIHQLDELTRRWGPELEDVIAWRDKAAFEVEDLDASPEKVDELRQQRRQAFDAALKAARSLGSKREAAARDLAKTVTGELSSLAMAGAKLEIVVTHRGDADSRGKAGAAARRKAGKAKGATPALASDKSAKTRDSGEADGQRSPTWPLDANGSDDIEFLFTPFPGSPRLPMGKSASGGELSRLMLALELSAAQKRSASSAASDMTFIFDEVDAGVGGKAAVELGRRLAKLAASSQVIVVTHLAQVASWADTQFVVAKGKDGKDGKAAAGGEVRTTVEEVTGDARVHEIARMLSGSESATSLDHAKELLSSSRL
ncbi:DNA repair protein RecN [Bifidobacterium sp. ESL0763]|uniref:DNA repair protein RecN n=1 Tax=Bifidobacterium sp. ESL0763 TaxID=2983227 RepID=UPI0023F6628E|nr:DNA repair protein RecN [Bifidobacterium sp. ESL0763]MDF7663740.1 DNA repair protein RecN [Bifidobacterium sp. ESL0763]